MLYLRYLSDTQVKSWGRQLDIRVWDEGRELVTNLRVTSIWGVLAGSARE